MEKAYLKRVLAAVLVMGLALGMSACGNEDSCTSDNGNNGFNTGGNSGEELDYKPVIYLYPEEKVEVTVELNYSGQLTCTYPSYNHGWKVTAEPDGTLTDESGQTYNYLYWEGLRDVQYDFSKGFCVAGKDTVDFLESALAELGLTRREANEFIVYWLPQMQDNPYNLISFQGQAYTQGADLKVCPTPDTTLRVFMAWKPLEQAQDIPKQKLSGPKRTGFTLVEWGGCQVK